VAILRRNKKDDSDDELLELLKTISMVKLIALDLQKTADGMQQQVERIKQGMGKDGR
jgi:hypothetical protein